jgi:16S rRNA C967 or C1407 C5-methylase (RsmB/RsmF family)
MCIKWIRQKIHYDKLLDVSDQENSTAEEKADVAEEKADNRYKFQEWYLKEFKEELESDCFKTLLQAALPTPQNKKLISNSSGM